MEVHHHQHTENSHTGKRFKHYFFEFFMLFLAVFAGFLAENFREYTVEKTRAKEYARDLILDLEKDTAMVRLDIRQIKVINSKIDSLTVFLQGKKINEISNRQLFAYTHFSCNYRPYTWSRATLEEIKSSGSLWYFDNDSIIMRISAYDAHTRHMDEDFNGDMQRNDRVSEMKNRIVDLNYRLDDSIKFWRINADSIISLIIKKQISEGNPDLQLLTNNINNITSLSNDYLVIRENLTGRGETELTQLISEAAQLTLMLKQKYHLQ